MNKTDPQLSDWYMSLETEFLLRCPKCDYTFPDTLQIVNGKRAGVIKCKRCGQYVEWKEKRLYKCKSIPAEFGEMYKP